MPSSSGPMCSTSRRSARWPPPPSTPRPAARTGPGRQASRSLPSPCRTTSSTAPPRPPLRPAERRPEMRSRNVIEMHLVNRMLAFGWSLIALAFALVVILAVGVIVGSQGPETRAEMYYGMQWNGAIFALLGPMIGYGFTSMGQYFPLALGLGLTRREFAAGVSLVFLGNAVAYSVLITIGKTIEAATEGFGLGVRFFDVFSTSTGAPWQTLVQPFLLILGVLFLGAAITSAFLLFGQIGSASA